MTTMTDDDIYDDDGNDNSMMTMTTDMVVMVIMVMMVMLGVAVTFPMCIMCPKIQIEPECAIKSLYMDRMHV